jgi:YD repeat-containing protein
VTYSTYDNLSELLSTTDANSRETTYSYNVLGQETSVGQPNPSEDPTNLVTSYTYLCKRQPVGGRIFRFLGIYELAA